MTYARTRLWLGVTGVGLLVVACVAGLSLQLPERFLPTSRQPFFVELAFIAGLVGLIATAMIPIDFLGGYLAPSRYARQSMSLSEFIRQWSRAVFTQSFLFIISSIVILFAGRQAGLVGATLAVLSMAILYLAAQRRLFAAITGGPWHDDDDDDDDKVQRSLEQAESWGLKRLPVTVIESSDPGFTGGVVGLPRFESIIIPKDFVDRLTAEQLAIVLSRRLIAVESGGRTRGILLALVWIVGGFVVSASLPNAGVTTIAALASTSMGFTVWTFLGLLTLPTVSRQSSYAIDSEILRRGPDLESFTKVIQTLDSIQDDEPKRTALIETIFHPVPSVENRRQSQPLGSPMAWHAARMTLFLSWSCMGILARAVHCNVGRPELWTMLPTD